MGTRKEILRLAVLLGCFAAFLLLIGRAALSYSRWQDREHRGQRADKSEDDDDGVNFMAGTRPSTSSSSSKRIARSRTTSARLPARTVLPPAAFTPGR